MVFVISRPHWRLRKTSISKSDSHDLTGSTRAGVLVAKAAADAVKRVSQELGGKSTNVILEDVDLAASVRMA